MDNSGQYDPNDPTNPNYENPIDTTNPDTIRQTSPDPMIRETQDGQTLDPNNNVADLPDGRQVEVPPSNLAAAKDVLAAHNAADRNMSQNTATDPAYDTSNTGLAGSASTGAAGGTSSTGVAGSSNFDPAYSPARQGLAGSPSYDANNPGMTNDPAYDPAQQGINTQGYDTVNQGLGSPAPDPNQPNPNYDPNQGLSGQPNPNYDPNQGLSGQQGGAAFDPNRGFDPNEGLSDQQANQGYGAGGASYGGANTDDVNDQPYTSDTQQP